MTKNPPSTTPKRPVALFSIVVILGVLMSLVTALPGAPLYLLWLPTSLTLVGVLTRGPSVLLPAILGLGATLWILGTPELQIAGAVAAVLIAPLLARAVISALRKRYPKSTRQNETLQLCGAIILVQAPVAAALLVAGWLGSGINSFSMATLFVSQWAIEATTGVIVVESLLSWMPKRGHFCPLVALRRAGRHLRRRELLIPLTLIASVCSAAALAIWYEQGVVARLTTIPVFAVAAASSLMSKRRIANVVLLVAAFAIMIIRVRSATFANDISYFGSMAEVVLLLLTGGMLLHLLSASAEDREVQERRLRRKVFVSEVTGLPNLRSLNAFLKSAKQIASAKKRGMLLAEVSISGLHNWADLAGRSNTMKVEREIGARLKALFGSKIKHISYVATGRFVLVLSNSMTDTAVADRLRKCFDKHRFNITGQHVQLSYSAGLVDVPPGSHEAESVLASLSIAQQQAVVRSDRYYRLTLNNEQVRAYREELAWVEEVRSLLTKNRLRLFAQPIEAVHPQSESGLHFEILARLADESGTIVAPDKFLPAISQAGIQIEFDRRVVALTLNYLSNNPGLSKAVHLCAINITGTTICDPHFADFLLTSLRQNGIDGAKLAIEVTESDSIADLEAALATIRSLADAGVQIAVDDFGTGHATFEYIRRLSPHLLKIDGSFVRRYAHNPLDREIVQSMVRMARAIGARTVAEFVETEEELEQMRELGVDFLQGWAIAKPMPIEKIKSYWSKRSARSRQTDKAELADA